MQTQGLEAVPPFRSYPVRPRRQTGEGVSAWVHRHYLSNGHRVHRLVHKWVSYGYDDLRSTGFRVAAVSKFNALLEPEQQIASSTWLAWGTDWALSDAFAWQRAGRRCYPNAFCPKCLLEYGYFLELWEAPGVDACPRHGVVLTIKCSACRQVQSNWTVVDGRYLCSCGFPLSKFKAVRATAVALEKARTIALNPCITLPPGYYFSCDREPAPIAPWIMTCLHRAVEQAGWSKQYARCEKWIYCGWPDHPRAMLRRMLAREFAGCNDSIRLVMKSKNSWAAFICAFLGGISQAKNPDAKQLVRAELDRLYVFQFDWHVLLVNPRIYPQGAGQLREIFFSWWKTIQWGDEAGEPSASRTSRFHRSRPKRLSTVNLVLDLIRLAEHGVPANALGAFWRAWMPPLAIRQADCPATLIDKILADLYLKPVLEVRSLVQLLAQQNIEAHHG